MLIATANRAGSLAIPLDHGCRLYQHHGVKDLSPVQPNPKQPKLKVTFALPPQDAHLMPKGDELKFKGGCDVEHERRAGKRGQREERIGYASRKLNARAINQI